MAEVPADLLAGARWWFARSTAGAVDAPDGLAAAGLDWLAADVPGTVAGALRSAGRWSWDDDDRELLDGGDWWYRCDVEVASGVPVLLRCEGLATLATMWLAGVEVVRSTSMWGVSDAVVALAPGRHELAVVFRSLHGAAIPSRPRARWRSPLIPDRRLRWVRTSLAGRTSAAPGAAPVGPWRPVRLVPLDRAQVLHRRVRTAVHGRQATVDVRLDLVGVDGPVELRLAGLTATMSDLDPPASPAGSRRVTGRIDASALGRWWPRGYGEQALHQLEVVSGDATLLRAEVGLRTVDVDRRDGGFRLSVNDVPVFCRGVVWAPPDPVTHAADVGPLRTSLELAAAAGATMVRVPGTGCYQPASFWDECDRLGLLVWQDCMVAGYDPPDEPAWRAAVQAEVVRLADDAGWRPSLAVVTGGHETYQHAAMAGLAVGSWRSDLLEVDIPAWLGAEGVTVPYVASTPAGEPLPFDPSSGPAHWFGVGAYGRPLAEVRGAGVRFAAECLALATPPERRTVAEELGGAAAARHTAGWRAAVPRDAGVSWDFEDVVDHYVRLIHGVEPALVRRDDPERALDLARATAAQLVTEVFGEWRRPASRCDGGIVLSWQDARPGAGWGLVDALGRPKSTWWAARRAWAPRAVWITDEGLSGLHVHVANDRPGRLDATLALRAVAANGTTACTGEAAVHLDGRSAASWSDVELVGAWRDLASAYRFGPPAAVGVRCDLVGYDGATIATAVHVPDHRFGEVPAPELSARHEVGAEGNASVRVGTASLARHVVLDVPGWRPSDNWFHLLPHEERTITLQPRGGVGSPAGTISCLDAPVAAVIA